VLCVRCNNALGLFQESHALFPAAAHYLDTPDPEACPIHEMARSGKLALA
jgi:hypothetical protein